MILGRADYRYITHRHGHITEQLQRPTLLYFLSAFPI